MVKSMAGIFMFKYILLVLSLTLASAVCLSAQTPVEKVILDYSDVPGSRKFIAQGMGMILARKFIRSTQVAPIASDVDQLYVLKMQGASQSTRDDFIRDLQAALKSYEYYGEQPSNNGQVSVYVHYLSHDAIDELVIYNPAISSVNSLYGHFTAPELMKLKK